MDSPRPGSNVTTETETDLIAALKRRDEAAFVQVVARYHGRMLRLALVYAKSRAVAEEVVQEAWLGVLRGLDQFEGRSSFKTWLFRIVVNRAKTRSVREDRTIPFSDGPAVPAERFLGADDPDWPHHWAVPPQSWGASADEQLQSAETMALIEGAIAALPSTQREVIALRDVDGMSSAEVCNILSITETNQRVLLHRARSRVRAALERHLG
jgi:RNA polymerase sigma-70 factor, ECF subfamily